MSTAKSPAIETVESPARVPQSGEGELTPADFAAILSTTLALAAEAHVQVGVRNAPATPLRPAGLMIFIAGLAVNEAGAIEVSRHNARLDEATP